jgi:hypothetical protein
MSTLFFHSYLFGFCFWSNFALGASALLMIYQLTGGAWGKAIEPILIAMTRTIYVTAALFIPLFFGINQIYTWATSVNSHTPREQAQAFYLNPLSFSVRSVIYFILWGLVAYFLARWSDRLRIAPDDLHIREKVKRLSAGGLVLYAFSVSFASIDWVMSLEPSWYSTVYGMVYGVAAGLSAFAFVLFTLPYFSHNVSKKALNDLANILLAFIMFWAYVSILQYVIIWSGNIPKEALWFNHRRHGGWGYLITLIASLQLAGPFLLLLFKDLKRDVKVLSTIGLLLLSIRTVDMFWLIMPAFHPEGWTIHLTDFWVFAAIGAVWILSFKWIWNRSLPKDVAGSVAAHA